MGLMMDWRNSTELLGACNLFRHSLRRWQHFFSGGQRYTKNYQVLVGEVWSKLWKWHIYRGLLWCAILIKHIFCLYEVRARSTVIITVEQSFGKPRTNEIHLSHLWSKQSHLIKRMLIFSTGVFFSLSIFVIPIR